MSIVSVDNTERAIDLIEQMNDEDFGAFAEDFTNSQPALATYLFMHEEQFSEDDFDLLANLALTVYMAYKLESGNGRELSPEEIEKAALAQMDALDAIENSPEEEIQSLVEKAFDSSKQPVLHDFVAHELHEMEAEGAIEDESGGAALYPILALVVDLLDDAFHSARLHVV